VTILAMWPPLAFALAALFVLGGLAYLCYLLWVAAGAVAGVAAGAAVGVAAIFLAGWLLYLLLTRF
jgi:hypothetical protein